MRFGHVRRWPTDGRRLARRDRRRNPDPPSPPIDRERERNWRATQRQARRSGAAGRFLCCLRTSPRLLQSRSARKRRSLATGATFAIGLKQATFAQRQHLARSVLETHAPSRGQFERFASLGCAALAYRRLYRRSDYVGPEKGGLRGSLRDYGCGGPQKLVEHARIRQALFPITSWLCRTVWPTMGRPLRYAAP